MPPFGRPLLIVIVAWNRPDSLRRLLRSLEQADYSAEPASMEVRFALDGAENATTDAAIDAAIDTFDWPHGDVLVRRRTRRAGLRDNVLGSWTGEEGRPAVMLEDDIEVSALWWQWAQSALERYSALPAVVGVSLYTPDDLNEAYMNGNVRGADGAIGPACGWQQEAFEGGGRGASAVLFAQPCSWGAVYLPAPWAAFRVRARELIRAGELPKVPCPPGADRQCQVRVNRWGRSSWKRLLVYHMVAEGLALAYPNLPRRTSFSTNHVEPGQHLATPALAGQRARHKVALVDRAFCARLGLRCAANTEDSADADGAADGAADAPFSLPAADEAALYDFYCQRQPAGAAGFAALAATGAAVRAKAERHGADPGGGGGMEDEDPSEYVVVRRVRAADPREL